MIISYFGIQVYRTIGPKVWACTPRAVVGRFSSKSSSNPTNDVACTGHATTCRGRASARSSRTSRTRRWRRGNVAAKCTITSRRTSTRCSSKPAVAISPSCTARRTRCGVSIVRSRWRAIPCRFWSSSWISTGRPSRLSSRPTMMSSWEMKMWRVLWCPSVPVVATIDSSLTLVS